MIIDLCISASTPMNKDSRSGHNGEDLNFRYRNIGNSLDDFTSHFTTVDLTQMIWHVSASPTGVGAPTTCRPHCRFWRQ